MDTYRVGLYLLAIITSLACTVLLFRGDRRQRTRLLMWSGVCFACLTLNNFLLFADLVVFPEGDLRIFRLSAAMVGMIFLLYGFIFETE
jgi:hypothetical protein